MNALLTRLGLLLMVLSALTGRAKDSEPADLKEGGLRFATDLYKEVSGREKGNLFLSPTSIHTALAMTYAGARGQTAAEMATALSLKRDADATVNEFGELLKALNKPSLDWQDKKPVYELSVANALWGQQNYPFNAEYTKKLNEKMNAKFESLNFGTPEPARKTINDWVEEKTKQRIKDLIPQGLIKADTRLVLTNAIYFKSSWFDDYFDEKNTKKGAFFAPDKEVQAELMHTNRTLGYTEDEKCQVVQIPYKNNDLMFYLILPRDKNGLAALEKEMTSDKLKKWLAPNESALVDLTLPRFKIESEFKLSDALKAMGMPTAFTGQADFMGMLAPNPPEPLYISEVLHKSFVNLDEKGTEAAAATAVIMAAGSAFREPLKRTVRADHPFLFVIQHYRSQSVLFMGRVQNPAP